VSAEKKILIVARWPLGGIRTYMRYIFRHFPPHYKLTLLASSTHENDALQLDAAGYGAKLVLARKLGVTGLIRELLHEFKHRNYDVILSQGFISAVAVYCVNLVARIPHVLTIHGVVEDKYVTGRYAWAKRFLVEKVLSGITVHYAVSNDILTHLHEQFPRLKGGRAREIVIPNGIDVNEFIVPQQRTFPTRDRLGIPASTYLFGFFGRFMHQKGFDLLIEAVATLQREGTFSQFAVLAVGSGDYLSSYQQEIKRRNLEPYFIFMPFQAQVNELYLEVDAIVMPSRWEASALLAMESLIMGVPLIAASCLGLRETVAGTPTSIFPAENISALSIIMRDSMLNSRYSEFLAYAPQARQRYDVSASTELLIQLISELTEPQTSVEGKS
jgi:glycosyltransferase involved in cell wall biosynthesis